MGSHQMTQQLVSEWGKSDNSTNYYMGIIKWDVHTSKQTNYNTDFPNY